MLAITRRFAGKTGKKLDDDQIGAFDPERESPFL
jgi:hypothetical protein